MSTTTQAPPVPIRSALRRYAVLVVLFLAIVAGAFTAYSLIGSEPSSVVTGVTVDPARAGGDGCAASFAVSGGVLEGANQNDGCGAPGGRSQGGGIQP